MSHPTDGRRIVKCDGVFPYKLRETQRRMLVMNFQQAGKSVHSGDGITLGVILEHCVKERISFTLKGSSKHGFIVVKEKGAT